VFHRVLDKYFGGVLDERTVRLLTTPGIRSSP
jgi:uncharacterized protein (DUF1810 family)